MIELGPNASVDSAVIATSNGRDFSQPTVGFFDDPQKNEEMFARWGDKWLVLQSTAALDPYADDLGSGELPKIIVVESFGLPNDDIGRRGC